MKVVLLMTCLVEPVIHLKDIEAMPMGMHTILMEGATTLSGVQKQRLMLARAIVRQPRILLLDEATSSLDNQTQAIVIASLLKLNVTRIVIAHRLSTITQVGQILVFERGRIIQTGSYEELVAQEGPFANLARRQLL
jgi:ABC-type bacteriocin/lantibiotic exporter with double-glycine peptidase domain